MVTIKRKVTIRTKTVQEETPAAVNSQIVTIDSEKPNSEPIKIPQNPPTSGNDGAKGSNGKAKWYAAALVGLLLLGGGGYYLSQQENKGDIIVEEIVEPKPPVGVVDSDATNSNQNGQNQTEEKDEAAVNTSKKATEGGVPPLPVQRQDDATPAKDNPTKPSADDVRDNHFIDGNVSSHNAHPTVSPTRTVEEEAQEVIRGKYGNGAVRKRNLGDRYAEIQKKVNEMYRNGQVQ